MQTPVYTAFEMSRIIAISGISGAGKTTLTQALAARYDSSCICWDDFDTISSHPCDYLEWHRGGRDYAQWDYPHLETALRNLHEGQIAHHPVIGQAPRPTPLVFFDAPLGRLHLQTARWIDLTCHISVSPDIALCRRLVRDYENPADEEPPTVEDVIDELRFYADEGHVLFNDEALVEAADIVLDGSLTMTQQLEAMDRHLRQRGYV